MALGVGGWSSGAHRARPECCRPASGSAGLWRRWRAPRQPGRWELDLLDITGVSAVQEILARVADASSAALPCSRKGRGSRRGFPDGSLQPQVEAEPGPGGVPAAAARERLSRGEQYVPGRARPGGHCGGSRGLCSVADGHTESWVGAMPAAMWGTPASACPGRSPGAPRKRWRGPTIPPFHPVQPRHVRLRQKRSPSTILEEP
jgi:hypothetical protein